MIRRLVGTLSIAAVLALSTAAAPSAADEAKAPAQGGEQHAMTPEQMAEMEAYQKAGTPGPQHAELGKAAGTYDVQVKSWHDPSGEPMVEKGTATRTMTLDGRVLVEDFQGSMMGMPFTGRGTTGFDNVTEKYWSTWNDSMSTGIMVSEGTCDAAGKCTFTGTWNDPIKKGPVSTRMTLRWENPTTQVFEMFGPGPDGKETRMMELTYTKK